MNLSDLAAFLAVGSPFVVQFLNVLKFVRIRNWNAITLSVGAWILGVGAAVVFANSDFAVGLGIERLNGWSLVIAGIALGSVASTAYDVTKAVDASQSAAKPPLVP